MAEKNRLAQASKNVAAAASIMGGTAPSEPTKLIVSELHPNISQADVSEVFSPFGEVVELSMPTDPASSAPLGIAHLTFRKPEDAKSAQEAINGLELAGKRISVALAPDAPPALPTAPVPAVPNALPNMLPNMMGMGGGPAGPGSFAAMPMIPGVAVAPGQAAMPGAGSGFPVGAVPAFGMPGMMPGPPSRCVLLKNMFDPNGEDARNDPDFFDDLCDDVCDEVKKHGDVLDSRALPQSDGHLYLKFSTEAAAAQCVAGLNGRWFAGKQVQASTVDEANWPN